MMLCSTNVFANTQELPSDLRRHNNSTNNEAALRTAYTHQYYRSNNNYNGHHPINES
jgi:hypothetical protein